MLVALGKVTERGTERRGGVGGKEGGVPGAEKSGRWECSWCQGGGVRNVPGAMGGGGGGGRGMFLVPWRGVRNVPGAMEGG